MKTRWEKKQPSSRLQSLPLSLPEAPAQGGLCPEGSSASCWIHGFAGSPPDTGTRRRPGSIKVEQGEEVSNFGIMAFIILSM